MPLLGLDIDSAALTGAEVALAGGGLPKRIKSALFDDYWKLNGTAANENPLSYPITLDGATFVTVDGRDGAFTNGAASYMFTADTGRHPITQPWSVGFWVRVVAGSLTYYGDKAFVVWDGMGYRGTQLYMDGAFIWFYIGGPGGYIACSWFGQIVGDTWKHVVLTYDGTATAAGVKLYVDGQFVEKSIIYTDSLAAIDYPSPYVTYFNTPPGGQQWGNATWDDIVFYRGRALGAAEVSGIFSSGPPAVARASWTGTIGGNITGLFVPGSYTYNTLGATIAVGTGSAESVIINDGLLGISASSGSNFAVDISSSYAFWIGSANGEGLSLAYDSAVTVVTSSYSVFDWTLDEASLTGAATASAGGGLPRRIVSIASSHDSFLNTSPLFYFPLLVGDSPVNPVNYGTAGTSSWLGNVSATPQTVLGSDIRGTLGGTGYYISLGETGQQVLDLSEPFTLSFLLGPHTDATAEPGLAGNFIGPGTSAGGMHIQKLGGVKGVTFEFYIAGGTRNVSMTTACDDAYTGGVSDWQMITLTFNGDVTDPNAFHFFLNGNPGFFSSFSNTLQNGDTIPTPMGTFYTGVWHGVAWSTLYWGVPAYWRRVLTDQEILSLVANVGIASWTKTFPESTIIRGLLIPGATSLEKNTSLDRFGVRTYLSLDGGVTRTEVQPGEDPAYAVGASGTLQLDAEITVYDPLFPPYIGGVSGTGPSIIYGGPQVEIQSNQIVSWSLDAATLTNAEITGAGAGLPRRIKPLNVFDAGWALSELSGNFENTVPGGNPFVPIALYSELITRGVSGTTGLGVTLAAGGYLQAADSSELRAAYGSPMSVACWIKGAGTGYGGYHRILSKLNPGSIKGWELIFIGAATNQLLIQMLENPSAGVYQQFYVPGGIDLRTDTDWHHLAFTWDGTTYTGLNLYLDGQLATPAGSPLVNSSYTPLDDGYPLSVGTLAGVQDWWNASVDDIVIARRVLTQQEIVNMSSVEPSAVPNASWATTLPSGSTLQVLSVPGALSPSNSSVEVFFNSASQGIFEDGDHLILPVTASVTGVFSVTFNFAGNYIADSNGLGPVLVYSLTGSTPASGSGSTTPNVSFVSSSVSGILIGFDGDIGTVPQSAAYGDWPSTVITDVSRPSALELLLTTDNPPTGSATGSALLSATSYLTGVNSGAIELVFDVISSSSVSLSSSPLPAPQLVGSAQSGSNVIRFDISPIYLVKPAPPAAGAVDTGAPSPPSGHAEEE